MRAMLLLGLAGLLTSNASPPPPFMPMPEGPETGLCRRPAPLAALPPEPTPPKPRQPRWESRDKSAPATVMPEPVPTPTPEPMPEPGTAGREIVVTGSLAPARSADTAMAVTSVTAEDIGSLPGVSTAAPPAPAAPSEARTADGVRDTTVPREPRPRAGLLTAGDHDDLLNPELYARYVDGFLKSEKLDGVPRVDTRSVLTVAVQDESGRPVPFAQVRVTCADGNSITLPTLADGTAAFFPELDRLGRKITLAVLGGGQAGAARRVVLDSAPGQQRQTLTVRTGAGPVRRFDLALVIDTTGSMGDELEYLKAELRSIVTAIVREHPGLDVRLALIPYRDVGDDYVTRTFPFTADMAAMQASLGAQSSGGGGDYPEAMEQAMTRAVALPWRDDAVKSLLLVADAPPHAENVAQTWHAAEWARAKRIQIVPVAASGVAEGAEYLMRAMAAATQSRYLFLTDDSGIGNPHAPPAIDCYLVTKLDTLVRRVLDGQISGRRVEPGEGELIRTVGTYDKGRCVLPPDFAKQG